MMALIHRSSRARDCILDAGNLNRCPEAAKTENLALVCTKYKAASKTQENVTNLFTLRSAQIAAILLKVHFMLTLGTTKIRSAVD